HGREGKQTVAWPAARRVWRRASGRLDRLKPVRTLRLGCTAGLLHRFDDAEVTAAAADVAGHPLANLVLRSRVPFANQRRCGTDLTGRAVAALESVVADECRLNGLQSS